jgi:hypothetical protein
MIALYYLGAVLALVGAIWLLVVAFKKSVWWGLGSFFIPFVNVIFAIMNWQVSKTPFLIMIGGIVLCVIGGWGMFSAGEMPGATT